MPLLYRLGARAVALLSLLCAAGGAQAQTSVSAEYTALCVSSTTLSADLQAACDAARVQLVQDLTRRSGVSTAASAQALQQSATMARIDQLTALRTAIAPNSATLAAIRATTVTVPSMEASVHAGAVQALAEGAKLSAARVKERITNSSCSVLVHDAALASIVRNRKAADGAVDLLSDKVERQSKLISAAIETAPKRPSRGGQDPRLFGFGESLPALAAGVSLVTDIVGNVSALVASFRPVVGSDSGTLTAAMDKHAAAALIAALVADGVGVTDFSSVINLQPQTDANSLRGRLTKLAQATRTLLDKSLELNKVDFSTPAADSPTVPRFRPSPFAGGPAPADKPADKPGDRAAANLAQMKAQAKTLIDEAQLLIKASDELRQSTLSDTPATGDKPAVLAPINDFDRLDALLAESRSCLYTLKLEPAVGLFDRFGKQRAFGSPDFSARAVVTMPWLLTDRNGRVVAGGNLLADSQWQPFGPAK